MTDLPTIGTMDVYANSTWRYCGTHLRCVPAMIDAAIGNTQGDVLYRGASACRGARRERRGKCSCQPGSQRQSALGYELRPESRSLRVTLPLPADQAPNPRSYMARPTSSRRRSQPRRTTGTRSGLSTANVIRYTNTTSYFDITGITAPASDGAVITIENSASNTYPNALRSQNANSTAANRFAFSSDIFLGRANQSRLKYSTDNSRWQRIRSP